MSSYRGTYAELYDLFYSEKSYNQEVQFIHDQFSKQGIPNSARLLDLACGTGRHALEFAKLDYRVVGVDISPDMIALAQSSAERCNAKVEFYCQNMCDLNVPGPFDAVTCLFDSIGFVQTNENIIRALEGMNRNLRPGGLLVVEFWHAGAMLRNFDPVRVRRWATAKGQVVRISQTSLDYYRQLAKVNYQVIQLHENGTFEKFEETQINRFFLVQEMAGFLSQAGFESKNWFSGFQEIGTITENTWHIVVIAQKI